MPRGHYQRKPRHDVPGTTSLIRDQAESDRDHLDEIRTATRDLLRKLAAASEDGLDGGLVCRDGDDTVFISLSNAHTCVVEDLFESLLDVKLMREVK